MYFQDKIILITGASSGIGEALAYEFAEQKATVLLCARNESELERVKSNISARAEIFVCDITDYTAVDAMMEKIITKYEAVDVLVNNAGISQRALAIDTDFSVDEKIMKVNYFAAVYLTKKILPPMLNKKAGNIIVISSVSGKYGFWKRSAYAASKHALHGFFETLQIELQSRNIRILLVCAGGVKTNISLNALKGDGSPHSKMDNMQYKGLTPKTVASKILKACESGKRQIFPGGTEVYLYFIKKWIPALFFRIAGRYGKKGR